MKTLIKKIKSSSAKSARYVGIDFLLVLNAFACIGLVLILFLSLGSCAKSGCPGMITSTKSVDIENNK